MEQIIPLTGSTLLQISKIINSKTAHTAGISNWLTQHILKYGAFGRIAN